MPNELSTNVCPKCKETSEEVLNMHKKKRVGWYCLKCHYFEEAILRETTIAPTIKKVRI
jgi:ribosomal protein S27AE